MRAFVGLLLAATFFLPLPGLASQTPQKQKLPKPRQLDKELTCRRDAAGEFVCAAAAPGAAAASDQPPHGRIITTTRLVPVTCSVFGADGLALTGLQAEDFRVYEDGFERRIAVFAAPSALPAGVALVIDASPSVLRDAKEMTDAARALMDVLARQDEVAVLDFSAHTYLQQGFSSDRDLLSRALARVDVRSLLGDTGGSNIYAAVYLTARELFAKRKGRKAIVLFTDGQDSGFGLTLDPASAAPQPGIAANRLTYEDVMRTLAADDIETFVISTEHRPKIMTPQWLAAHRDATLLTAGARKAGIPAYTLYLAEAARRSGGQIHFLREADSLAETFRHIAERVSAEYLLAFTPATGNAAPKPGWHRLRVEVVGHAGATAASRAAYYVPAAQ